MTSRSSPWMFSRFLTSSPANWPSSSRSYSSSRPPRNSAAAPARASNAASVRPVQPGLDRPLPRLRERDDADGGPRLAGQKAAHEMRDVTRFGTVAPVLVPALLEAVEGDGPGQEPRGIG